jgi:hypothetical protein
MGYLRDIKVVDYTYNKFNPRSCDFDVPDFMNKFISNIQEHSESLQFLISRLSEVSEIHVYNFVNTPDMMRLEVFFNGEKEPQILKGTNIEGKLSGFIRHIYYGS